MPGGLHAYLPETHTRCGRLPSAFRASTAARYAGFLSTFMTRGIALPDASIALTRKRLAAAVSRLAINRKSIGFCCTCAHMFQPNVTQALGRTAPCAPYA